MAIISLRDVHIFTDEVLPTEEREVIVSGATFSIEKGEWVHVVGRNGSGKSTLARAIAGYGNMHIEGEIERNLKDKLSSRRLPLVLQLPDEAIVGSTPWEDVLLTLEFRGMKSEEIQAAAAQALERFGLGSAMHHPIQELSGGQKQLTAAAAALATGAPLLLMDEVTSMLDPDSSQVVLQTMRRLHQEGISILSVTQKLEELQRGDRVLALDDGKVVFDGVAEDFFTRSVDSSMASTEIEKLSLCEQLGLEAPYVVQTAWALEQEGITLGRFPLSAEDLVQEVNTYGE